jgi:hypothetical protein
MPKKPHLSTSKTFANRPPTDGRRGSHRTGPYSRAINRGAVGGLNGNTREAKYIQAYEAMLTEHCGGHPSPVQRQLIIRAARLACHLELWDERTIPAGGAVTATGHNHYIQWQNALVRTLARLGLNSVAGPAPSLQDALAGIVARRRPEPRDDGDEDAA